MKEFKTTTPEREEALYEAILQLKNTEEAQAFFADLCTPAEVKAMTERWQIAQRLGLTKLSYQKVAEATGASLGTVTRVARFLKKERYQGYKLILERVKNKINFKDLC